HIKSGLRHAIEVLSQVEEISFNFFVSQDVVRHPVVARIVEAYEAFDRKEQALKAEKERRDYQHNASQPSSQLQPQIQQEALKHES
ncbi:MAG: PhoH family protein, partial [Shewanella sp.]